MFARPLDPEPDRWTDWVDAVNERDRADDEAADYIEYRFADEDGLRQVIRRVMADTAADHRNAA